MPSMALNGRILTVGSEAHRQAAPFLSEANETTQSLRNRLSSPFLPAWYKNYARSKLGNNLMTLYINDELDRRKSSVRASCISPGRVQTAIFRDLNGPMGTIIKALARFIFQTPSQGASGVLKIATDPSYTGRELDYVHCGRPSVPSPAARDRTIANKFWRWSMDAVNLHTEDDAVLWPRR
jgi:NAD(P)-dependent dehydrogenase (short-subunit alcohol dehydrogenase family)